MKVHNLRRSRVRQRGLTLLELIIACAVGAVLVGLGVPGMSELLARHTANADVADLHADLAYARGEAVRRAAQVTICRRVESSATPACATGGHDWSNGWIVFVDRSAETGSHDPVMGEILKMRESLADRASLGFNAPRGASLTFDAQGWPDRNFVGGTFTLCVKKYPQHARKLIISRLGRARSEKAHC